MQVELHRHLDVSTRISTLHELAQELGLEGQSTSLEAFRSKISIQQPMSNLHDVLARFTIFQKVLKRPDILERVAYETLEDCWNEGTRWVELRYSPAFVSEFSGLGWSEILEAFETGLRRGLSRFPDMKAGLICIVSRDASEDVAAEAVEFFLNHRDRMIGLDLAGNEAGNPCRRFEGVFKKAVQSGANITIHAGEGAGAENVWEAIELLGARRIGHGVASIHDSHLVETLVKRQICLEMCPTSNWLVGATPSVAEHPLPRFLRMGVPVCVNTDDPGIFNLTLSHELELCKREMGLSAEEIEQCQRYAQKASFLNISS